MWKDCPRPWTGWKALTKLKRKCPMSHQHGALGTATLCLGERGHTTRDGRFYLHGHREDMRKGHGKLTSALSVCEFRGRTSTPGNSSGINLLQFPVGMFSDRIRGWHYFLSSQRDVLVKKPSWQINSSCSLPSHTPLLLPKQQKRFECQQP